jgi:hypothetical protein
MERENFPKMKGTLIVAFGHRARQGKDSAALAVHQANGARLHIERFGFADALKAAARVRFGMREKNGNMLQQLGDEHRNIDPDVFLRALYYTIAERAPQVALITDLRTPDEMDFVKKLGGFAVRVERRNAAGDLVLPKDRDPNHPTEISLANSTMWDSFLTNHEGRLEEFKLNAVRAFKGILLKYGYGGTPKAA